MFEVKAFRVTLVGEAEEEAALQQLHPFAPPIRGLEGAVSLVRLMKHPLLDRHRLWVEAAAFR